ncbi:MAG TPA: DUF6159 family protein [Thermoguttaceae bacterium]|nr:DUF6159 family protein [Thermoguttaceae bacterium]
MFDRMSRGWELARESWNVLKLDKELLVFPILSSLACLVVLASFAVPLWGTDALKNIIDEKAVAQNPLVYVVLFLFYFCNYFVIVFFNSALVGCAIIRFKGGDPTVGDGLRAAADRLPQILGWALVSATVGLILRIIESRSEKVGQIVAGLLGMGWSAATYFVVPVIVIEKKGPIEATKRSFAILRRTWGEALTANFGIGFVVFLASLVGIVPIVLGAMACGAGLVPLGVAAILLGVIILMLVSLVSSALSAIVIAALYLYAAEGSVPRHFDNRLLSDAFVSR